MLETYYELIKVVSRGDYIHEIANIVQTVRTCSRIYILYSLKALTTTLGYSHIVCELCISYNKNKLLALFSWRLGDLIRLTSFLIVRDVQFRLILDEQDYIFRVMDLEKIPEKPVF